MNEKCYDHASGICASESVINTDSKIDSESLRTIRELNTVFANRLKDCEDGEKVTQEKLIILQQWVDSLTEQNVMLIEVVETFEKEAVHQLKVGFESQKLQNKELQVLQQQMTCKNRIIEAQQKALEKLSVPVEKLREYDNTNNNHTECLVNGDIDEESRIANSMETSDSRKAYQACSLELESTKKQLQNVEKEKEALRKNVDDVEKKIEKLNHTMVSNEKVAREMRAALTTEVAEKHDQVVQLRRDAQAMEERLRQADMQTHFKDDIIKELRKQIKIATNKLTGQLRDKDVAVNNLEEKLKIFRELPVEVSAQLYHLKQRFASLNELLAAAAKLRNEPKNEVQLVLNSILFNLNEALLLVDGYRCDGGASTLKPDERQRHRSSSNISDQADQNQMPMNNIMINELQNFKKLLEDDKMQYKKIDDDIRSIMNSMCNGDQPGNAIIIKNDLDSRLSSLHSHLEKYQESKEKVYIQLCCLQNDQKDKVTPHPSEKTCNVRLCTENYQSGSDNLQCDRSRDVTIRKLTNDLQELNCQLKSREKIISNQQETIDLLQNSLQMEQTEMESLKVEKEKADAQIHALQAKVLMLEAELKVVQVALSSNSSIEPRNLSGGAKNQMQNPAANKTWAPWAGKQPLPTHRHVHDV